MTRYYLCVSGVVIAFVMLWGAGAYFVDSPTISVPVEELKCMAFPAGAKIDWRSEGWAESRIGEWGIPAIPDIRRRRERKVILWGDSYVQGLQVSDDDKMAQILTTALKVRGYPFLAVSAGFAGQSAADYLTRIPVYENRLSDVTAHVVVIGHLEDLLPDQSSARYARFVSSPEYSIIEKPLLSISKRKALGYQWAVRLRANGLWSMIRRTNQLRPLRFRWGPLRGEGAACSRETGADAEKSFEYLARRFRASTRLPLILVYIPTIPRLEHNGWALADENAELAGKMTSIFQEAGWIVVNMEETFRHYFSSSLRPTRGFPNSKPGAGHLNKYGHRLVGEAIADVLDPLLEDITSRNKAAPSL